ncbi:hypothetical protein H6G04_03145 [Calothrix membranacea FACHB-236]|nr:hypothetical protein [Calothrix membranacea FACHB-236]
MHVLASVLWAIAKVAIDAIEAAIIKDAKRFISCQLRKSRFMTTQANQRIPEIRRKIGIGDWGLSKLLRV